MHDAAPVRAMMRWSVPLLLLLLAVGACGSTATPGPDGGGGSNAAGAGGTTSGGGRGGGSGGAAGSAGGQSGGGGTSGCAPQSSLVSRLRARHRRLLFGRLSRRRVSSAGRRSRLVWIGRRVRQQRRRRARRHHRLGRCWRRVWLQWPRRHRRWIGRHGRIRAVRRARVHEQRALRATQLWRHRSALQSAPRWRPMSDRMDLSAFLQHFTDTGARLRGAAVHTSHSFLHHAARVVRRHGHLRLPPDERLPERRGMRPHQWRGSPVSIGLTFTRAGQLAATGTLAIVIAGGCGSVNSTGGDAAAGTSGQGGHAGDGAGGSAGIGGTTGSATVACGARRAARASS
jgi:hypothetical protein